MSITEQKAAELRKPFPKNVVGKLPKGGTQLDYVGHAATTDRLLAVDPAWSWEPVAFDEQGLPAFDSKRGLWIRLTVCGVTRYGYGDGTSVKECIGDAIRNAAMRFGVALDLWSKDELEQTSTGAERLRANLAGGLASALSEPPTTPDAPAEVAPASDPITGPMLSKLQILLKDVGLIKREEALAYYARVTGRDVDSSKALSRVEAGQVLDDLERAKTGEPNLLEGGE